MPSVLTPSVARLCSRPEFVCTDVVLDPTSPSAPCVFLLNTIRVAVAPGGVVSSCSVGSATASHTAHAPLPCGCTDRLRCGASPTVWASLCFCVELCFVYTTCSKSLDSSLSLLLNYLTVLWAHSSRCDSALASGHPPALSPGRHPPVPTPGATPHQHCPQGDTPPAPTPGGTPRQHRPRGDTHQHRPRATPRRHRPRKEGPVGRHPCYSPFCIPHGSGLCIFGLMLEQAILLASPCTEQKAAANLHSV